MSSAAKPQTDAAAIEADARSKLSRFQQIHPLRSAGVGGRAWLYRRTPGRSSEQLPVVMMPVIQGGGDVFFEDDFHDCSLNPWSVANGQWAVKT